MKLFTPLRYGLADDTGSDASGDTVTITGNGATIDAAGNEVVWDIDANGQAVNIRYGRMATTQSLIDEAGNEKVWEVAYDGSGPYNLRNGRPAVTHSLVDAAGQEKIWETAWDGSGIYNLRDGAYHAELDTTRQPVTTPPVVTPPPVIVSPPYVPTVSTLPVPTGIPTVPWGANPPQNIDTRPPAVVPVAPVPTIVSTTSTIDAAGNEIVWDIDSDGQAVNIRQGRPAVTHSLFDAAGQQKVWETAWDGSGIYNLRNGVYDASKAQGAATTTPAGNPATPTSTSPTLTPHSLIDSAGQEKLWDTDTAGNILNLRNGRAPVTHSLFDAAGQQKLWEVAYDGSGPYNLRNGVYDPSKAQGAPVNPGNPPATPKNPDPAPTGTVTTTNPPGSGTTTTTGTTDTMKSFTHPVSGATGQIPASWVRVGTDGNGNPVFQVQDSSGAIKQFSIDGKLQFIAASLVSAATLGVMVPYTVTPPASSGTTGTTGTTGGTMTTTTSGGGNSMLLWAAVAVAAFVMFRKKS